MVNNYKRKALVVNIDVLSTRYDRISTVRDIRNNVSGELRKESAPPKILIDGTCLVFYNVPRNKLELVLKKSQRTSIEHGQSFTYVIEEKQLSEEEIIRVLEQDNLNLEQLLSGKDAEMHDLKTGYDELQRNAAEIRKVSDEYKGELKLLKLKDKAPTFQAVRKDECLIVNSYKAVVELVSTYSQNLGVLDENFKPISKLHPEVNLDKLLEIADMGFEKFVMKEGGKDLAVAMYSLKACNSFIDPSKLVNDEEKSDLKKLKGLHVLAEAYSKLIKSTQEREQVLPCAIVPKNANEFSIYVPSGSDAEGVISNYLCNTLKGILEKKDMQVIIQKRGLTNEIVVKFNGGATPYSLARRLAVELRDEANKILPNKIGHKLVVVNALKD